ncbi:DsbA family oxidoreductase [Yinghuangia soli]|uniref:DsbA family oxidoreductase n=1 Tax=Yinghuangia soli TaxID=2908204 RepID=A0AA41PUL9_9ACTN|nr:DsbA family oxidoreductase [Yinghuangia soli]MCF2526163.1 DsbA family oxidoreductase [Yinghuangia soli]
MLQVEVYSDIACPWCYVGKRRFEKALAQFPGGDRVEVVYRPYQLDPTTPEKAGPLSDRLAAKFGREQLPVMHARLNEVGAGEGISFDFDNALAANTLTGHRLLWHALDAYGRDTQAALKDRLLKAYFSEGADIGDRELLTTLAAEAGLDRDRTAEFLASGAGLAEVQQEIDEAREIGVTAVPTFVFQGKWAVQGAQETETFLQVLQQVAGELGIEDKSVAADDSCADGACAVEH